MINNTTDDPRDALWRSVDPGGNGWAAFWGIHPGNGHLFVSSDMKYSLFRSRDRGESWEPIANPVTGTAYCVAGDPRSPEIVYMSQVSEDPERSGIWRSQDEGDSWEQVCRTSLFGTGMGQSGLVDPDDPERIFWAAGSGAVFASADRGRSWEPLEDGLPAPSIPQERHLNALELDYEGGAGRRLLYYPTERGLYRLSVSERRWRLVKGGRCNQVAVCSGGIVYAASPDEGLFKSADSGDSWEGLDMGLEGKLPFRVAAARLSPEIVYVATVRDRGVYRSSDGGRSFRLLTRNRHEIGNNWPLNYRGLEAVSGMVMLLDPADHETLYLDYNKKTHDGGETWLHYGTRETAPDRWSGTGLSLLTDYVAEFDPRVPGKVWLGFSDIGLALTEDGGLSLHCVPAYHRGEVNEVARFRDDRVYSSGSCPAIAVDPERPSTVFATISGKQGPSRAMQGGMMMKTVDGGWSWDPIGPENGLPDGIVRAIRIDPRSPARRRALYACSYGNGVYRSEDGGESFRPVLDRTVLGDNTRVMDLAIARGDTRVLYAAVGGSRGIRPLTAGPEAWPRLRNDTPGGVFRSDDGGRGWTRCGGLFEFRSVQQVAVDPEDDGTVYAASFSDPFFDAPGRPRAEGGLYRSRDGGRSWELLFRAPANPDYGLGEVSGVAVNPALPGVLHVAVQGHGVFGSMDGGASWYQLGKRSMDRRQRRYHSIAVNPHDPAELWVAHFGSSFAKTIDPAVRERLQSGSRGTNLVRNGDFAAVDPMGGFARHWIAFQPPRAGGADPILSIVRDPGKGTCVRVDLGAAYTEAPSARPADLEQRRLEAAGELPAEAAWAVSPENRGDTRSWLVQNLDPHVVQRVKGKRVRIAFELKVLRREDRDWWLNWAESCEVERHPPQLCLYEARERNLHRVVAETSIEGSFASREDYLGRWIGLDSEGVVSERALGLELVMTGSAKHTPPLQALVAGIGLYLADEAR